MNEPLYLMIVNLPSTPYAPVPPQLDHEIVPLANDAKIKQTPCLPDNVVNDMFSFLFLGNHHVCGVPIDLLHHSIKDALSDRIEKTITMLCGMHKEIKSFQRENDDVELDLDGFTMNHPLTTHVLTFEQKEGPKSRIRTFLCTCDRGSLRIVLDFYGGIFDPSTTIEEIYNLSLLHAATCLLRDCFGGTIFPTKLVEWLSSGIEEFEHVSCATLDLNCTWLLSHEPNHWSTQKINKSIMSGSLFSVALTRTGFLRNNFSRYLS